MQKTIVTFADMIKNVRRRHPDGGTVLEFGVGRGVSYQALAAEIVRGWNCTLTGFDSFEGLPEEPEHVKRVIGTDGKFKYEKGLYAHPQSCTEDRLRRLGIKLPDERFKLIEGWLRDTLTPVCQQAIKNLIFVNVDVDIYTSAVTVLEFLTPLLQQGTVLYFNDWFQFEKGVMVDPATFGEGRAFREWIETHPKIEYISRTIQHSKLINTSKYLVEIQ